MNKRSGWVTFFAIWQFIGTIFSLYFADRELRADLNISIFLVIWGGLSIVVGIGLLNLKNWARIIVIIKSIPELFFFPIGTIISGATIYYFTRKKTKYIWRFSTAWKDLCVSRRMAKNNALVNGLIALEKNNRKKARRIWESLQRNFPKDYRVTHALALFNYWEAVSAKNPKGPTREVVEKSIGNWVMLLNSDFFWEVWRGERQPFYFQGNISKNQIEEVRHALKAHLENTIFRDHQNVLLLESKTAELLSNVAEWGEKKGLDSQLLIAGPLMLKEFGMLEKARQLALFGLQVEPENNDFKSLCQYLSPLGIATLLLRAERVENTFEELGKIENRDRWITKEFKKELSAAIIKWANQSQNDNEAIDRLERATKIILDNELSYLLSTYYEKVAIKVANEEPPNWNRAIECLKRALNLFRSVDIEKNIAVCLYQRALEKTNNLLKALEKLRNKQPRVRVGSIIDNKFGGILLPDIIARLQSQPSCDYCPNPHLIYGDYMTIKINSKNYNMCMSWWSKEKSEREKILFSLRGECLDDLREANKFDPDNQNTGKSLQDLEGIVSQIQESLR